MKIKSLIAVAASAAMLALGSSAQATVTFGYSNQTNSLIQFNGDGTFTFTPSVNNIKVTTGNAIGLPGEITGTYTIGAITTIGGLSIAPVTGTGMFVIHDGASDLVATLQWIDITQTGGFDSLNVNGDVNLTSITYSGTNPDLLALKAAGSAANEFAFQFTTVVPLSSLASANFSATFNGTVTADNPPPCNCTVTFTSPAAITNCAGDVIPPVTATEDCGNGPSPVTVTFLGAATNGTCPMIITRTNTATDDCGTIHTFVQKITVNCSPDCTITTSTSSTVAGTANLTASVPDAGTGATYQWSILNGTITAGQGTTKITWTAGTNTNTPVTIFVTVTAASGCQSSCNASVKVTPPPACTITGVTISNTSWNKFSIPNGTSPSVWVHMHIGGLSGVPKNNVTTIQFVGVTLSLDGTSYALPDGIMTFDPSAPSTITTTFTGGKWLTLVNPNNLSDEMFFTGAAIPVTPAIAAGAKATVTYTTLASIEGISFQWQWSAAVYTFWPTDWNQAMIQPYHSNNHAGTPLNTTVQKSLIQGPRGGGGSNFTGSWSATGTAACQ